MKATFYHVATWPYPMSRHQANREPKLKKLYCHVHHIPEDQNLEQPFCHVVTREIFMSWHEKNSRSTHSIMSRHEKRFYSIHSIMSQHERSSRRDMATSDCFLTCVFDPFLKGI